VDRESRRAFLSRLGHISTATAALWMLRSDLVEAVEQSATTQDASTSMPSTGPVPASLKSVVTHIQSQYVYDVDKIHTGLLREMLEFGVVEYCLAKKILVDEKAVLSDAWKALFQPNDVIGIKLSRLGAKELGTAVPLAVVLVESLNEAGFDSDQIILIEAPDDPAMRKLKTKPQRYGWSDQEVAFGRDDKKYHEKPALVLDDVTALINVPLLKTHNIFGISGCLKNISYPFVRRESRYFKDGGVPYMADIVALPQICKKLKLNIVNALRVVFDGGPAVRPGNTWPHNGLLISRDPVAADQIGIDIIDDERQRRNLPPIADANGRIPHIHDAAQQKLGTDDQDYINLIEHVMK